MFILLPSFVSAHTHLAGSTPAAGQVIVDELKELTLTFDGNIEKLSSMKVLKDGNELPAIQVQIEAERMKGILPEPLENGAYVIQWSIAGEDGHPLTGEINFTVQKEEKTEENNITPTDQGQVTQENSDSLDIQVTAATDDKSKSNSTSIITIIGFVIILGIGLLMIRRKR
jgi:copper resistance protein C